MTALLKLGAQSRAMSALAALAIEYPNLPAVSAVVSGRGALALSLHKEVSTFADFEVWREALRIPAEQVVMRERTFDSTLTLEAEGEFDGVPVRLLAYGPLHPTIAPEPATALKAVAA